MARVFVTRELPPKAMERLRSCPLIKELIVNPNDRVLSRDELLSGVKSCDYLLSQLTDRIDVEVFEANPRLKLVANYAVGFNNIDVKAATARKVPVSNTPGVLTESTADLAFTLLLSISRRIVEADQYMRAGKYKGWAPMLFLGSDVFGKTIGIVGLGRIGFAVAQRAKGFSMKILYTDTEDKPYAKEVGAERVSMERLLAESDYVTLHPFLDDSTTHMMDEAQFKQMKPTSYIINAARGAVINEKALVKALQQGWIAGAGLDVYEREPEMEPELASMPNVIVVPHIASATIETRTAMGNIAVDNIFASLEGKKLPSCVNPEVISSL